MVSCPMVTASLTPPATSLEGRRAWCWSVFGVCVVLAMLVPVSLQSIEYPLVPWEDMWQEVDMMAAGKNCEPETSTCWHVTNSTTSKTLVKEVCRPCACDEACVHYGDCCRDKAQADWGDGREEGSGRYNCRRLRPWNTVGLLMVDSCLPEYRNHPVERLCTQQVPHEEYSYFLDLCVTSRLTNTTYINYHCAVCNNDASNLHSHNVTINCRTTEILKEFSMESFMREATYFPGALRLQRYVYATEDDKRDKIHRESHQCTLQVAEFKEPRAFAEAYGGRLCMYPKSACTPKLLGRKQHCREQVRHCDPEWPDQLDVEKCHRYSQMVLHTVSSRVTLYKNLHCAKCNFVNMSLGEFRCLDPYDNYECSSNIFERNFFSFPPVFSVLMDFRNTSCDGMDELWDPIYLTCKKVFCGQLYKLNKGVCVKDSCRKIRLSEHEYTPLSDGSVFVNITDRVYKEGEYEKLSEGDVLICYDYVANFTTQHQLLTLVTMVISLVGLGLHIVIFMLVPRYRNLPGKNLFSLACCLFLAHLLFLTGIRATEYNGLCVFFSAALHFFWLACFCWMNVMSVDVCRTFTSQIYRGDTDGNKTYAFYSLYAWGVPTLVVALALIFDYIDILPEYRPEYATNLCWINNQYGLVLFFLLPQGAVVLENTLLFLVTARGIYKQVKAAKYANIRSQSVKAAKNEKNVRIRKTSPRETMQNHRNKKERLRLIMYVKLAVIQGVSWVTGFIAAFTDLSFCWYIFTVFNGLQGALIFFFFDMKKKVWESVWESLVGTPWRKRKSSKDTRITTTSGRTNSGHTSREMRDSDSDGGSEHESALAGPLIRQKCVSWEAGTGVEWTASPKHCPSPAQSHGRVRKTGTTGSQKTNLDQSPGQRRLGQETEVSLSQPVGIKKGDLRALVVRGNFDGEDEAAAKQALDAPSLPQDQGDTQQKKNKPNVQRVIDLLQQLQQQSRSSVDLPDLVQQLLRLRCNGDSLEAVKRDPATLSKCWSFTEGTCPELKNEQQKALVAQLRSMMAESFKADGHDHPKDLRSLYQPHSLNHTPNNSYSSLNYPSKSHPSQLHADNEAVTLPSQKTNTPHDTSSHLQRIPKSQSFSQISKAALAASVMQRAAMNARERRCHEAESTCVDDRHERENPHHTPVTKKADTSESLV